MSAQPTKRPRKAKTTPSGQPSAPLSVVYPNAAGLDIGKEEILAAVPADRDTAVRLRSGR
jgi:hypothetical protein